MAGELKHKDVGPELTYDEYHSLTSHTIDGVDAGTVIAGKATLAEVKADTDVADAITNSHAPGSDNQVIPDQLSDLSDDETHRLVTDTEKSTWNGKTDLTTVKADTDIASAISLKHTQGTDQGLDTGGLNAVTAAEVKGAVTNSHAPGSDNQVIPDQLSDLSDDETHRLVTDTEKSTWNGKTDLSTVKADTDVASAISLKHTQGTDQGLDAGGENAVTAAQAKAGYTHSGIAHAPSDAVSLATVKADVDVADAISTKHAAVTVSAPIALSGQALSLVNDAAAAITEIDTGALADSDTVIPTSKAVATAIAAGGGGTDEVARDNIVNLAWRLAIAEGLSVFNLEDGVVDEFEDETGVDTTSSTNESYNSTDDYYSPSAGVVVDNMEYSSDTNAQAAYVTNATYGSDVLSGGTPTADSEASSSYSPDKAVDNNESTYFSSANTAFPHWWKYDLGSGKGKAVQKIRIKAFHNAAHAGVKDFTLAGSNDDSTYTTLVEGQHGNNINWEDWAFFNNTTYRYYKITGINNWRADNYFAIYELELLEISLQSYSESTIKTQGSYSLKGFATTDALNKTLTRTIGSPIDLSGVDTLRFDIYSSRTGGNIKIGIHDSGGTTTEITPNITSADTFQEVEFDLSGVADANKDAIDSIIVTIVNADSANTFYIDKFSGPLENMTLISNSIEAETEPTIGRFLALVEPVDSVTINTDIKGYISLDDGSNYEEVTLADEGYFDSTKKIYAGNKNLTDRSDKTMRQKLQTFNNKDLKVHAWGMLWK